MSTDPGSPQHPGAGRRFRFTAAVTIAVLAIVAACTGTASYLQGPQVRSASMNANALVSKPGQQLVLHTDQRLRPVDASAITVTPAVPVDVRSSGSDVTVSFTSILDYATRYSVSFGATGEQTGVGSIYTYSFTTPDAHLYSLVRHAAATNGSNDQDRVLVNALKGQPGEALSSVFDTGKRIGLYAVMGDLIATVETDDVNAEHLVLSDPSRGNSGIVATPRGIVTSLRASQTARVFGYTVGSPLGGAADPTSDRSLMIYDPYDASGVQRAIAGPDGSPLRVVDWRFVPGTSSLVAQSIDQQLYLVDYLAATVKPMGKHETIQGFLPGTLNLVVTDVDRASVVDLTTGVTTPLMLPRLDIDASLFPSRQLVLSSTSFAQEVHRIDFSKAQDAITSSVYVVDGSGTRKVFSPPSDGSRIDEFCTSPNGEYLAIEVIPPGAQRDGYTQPGYADEITYLVDIRSGAYVRSVPGAQADWCN